jgi:predicted ATPase
LKKVSPGSRQLFPEIFRRNVQQWRSYSRFHVKDSSLDIPLMLTPLRQSKVTPLS